jgi:tRNA-2-methylthio-N6-dimethylallyladenosine synthase
VVAEAAELASQGFREITLLGQTSIPTARTRPATADFADLLTAVDAVDGIARIRYMTFPSPAI